MSLVTVPMALLTLASIGAGAMLMFFGDLRVLIDGCVIAMLGYGAAVLLERLIVYLDDQAIRASERGRRRAAHGFAALSGGFPMLVFLSYEWFVFRQVALRPGDHPLLLELWSYGVATGPWTLFAAHVSRFRRTLCGIRAYAGHLAYWLLAAASLGLDAPPPVAAALMLLPAILPFIVGLLLALADRNTLTNVRV
ncbi:hypothetical protein [Sphingomonas morindae]|uniref:Uncharacterized protein n=1 Tax=Sphingomonas morindae TaxID=1541170 RepID=A0ABY4X650_9SPHN|nr:hypothetical protein [Sphingomonas morindae]USI72370.1 hypothetical protein LHA26_13870 [Sphingomonas morindae]